jgi:signal transduction histidine kinase
MKQNLICLYQYAKGVAMAEHCTDDQLIEELKLRFERSRKAFGDISVVNRKLMEMNQRLEQSEALKSNFLSNIRNEINNPLNAIIGLAGNIASISGNQQIEELAAMLFQEAFNLDFQLRNIFIAAELEAGEAAPVISRVNLLKLVEEVISSFNMMAPGRDVRLMVRPGMDEPCTDEPVFPTDAEKLQVVFSNLLANAIEFSEPESPVDVTVEMLQDGRLSLRVEDHGIGIDESDQKKIFDRFVQLDSGATRMHKGHGIGLSVVKSLVELLEGQIIVESKPGLGSCFVLLLPPSDLEVDNMFADGGNMFFFDEMAEK